MNNKYFSFVKKIISFGFISAIGLSIDIGVYLFLLKYGFTVFLSSLIGSISAVTCVFIFSGLWIFRNKSFNLSNYLLWIIYQFCNILFFSVVVSYLCSFDLSPLYAKLSIIPVSFFFNFFVMSFLKNKN